MKDNILQNVDLINGILSYTLSGICIFEYQEDLSDFTFRYCNEAFYFHNNFLKGDIVGEKYKEIFPMSLNNGMYDRVTKVYQTGKSVEFTLKYLNSKRGLVYQQQQLFKISDKCVVCMFNDITEIKRVEEAIRIEKVKYSETIDSLNYGVVTTDNNNKITLINRYAMEKLGIIDRGKVINKQIDELYKIEKAETNLLIGELVDNFDVDTLITNNGIKQLVVHKVTPFLEESGESRGYVYSFEDVTTFVKTQEELTYLNYHDVYTGFYNRQFLKVYIENNKTKSNVGVIYADINGLSRVNDSKGVEVGDKIIKYCAESFKNNLPENTVFVRFGEDDFVAIVPLLLNENITRLSLKIKDDFEKKCNFVDASLSIGTSVVGVDAVDINEAVQLAQEKMNSHKIMSKQSVRSSALQSLLATLQVKSYETEEHAQRLNDISHMFAMKLGLNEKELNYLALLSVLHDIGKIGVPEYVLDKPDKLTDDEWKIMRNHTILGYKIMISTPELEDVAPLVRGHHERWDGKGYPDGLKGEEIPILDRVISIVDSYDAMVNNRVYRKALPLDVAMNEITKNGGTQFDPNLVNVFKETVNEYETAQKNRESLEME